VRTCLRSTVSLFAMFTIATAGAAPAEDYTRIDLTDNTIGFSSPGNAYGPWIYQDLTLVFVEPGRGAVNFEVAHQADGDVAFPTHGDYFVGGITRDLTSRVWVWGQFGYGTNFPYARTDVHVEGAYKTTPDLKLVLDASEDFVDYWSGENEKLFEVGPSYYYGTGAVQLRYVSSANSGAETKGGALISWDITPTFRSTYTLTGLFGPQQYLSGIPGFPLFLFNSYGQTYTFSTAQELGRTGPNGLRWGLKAGALLSHLTNSTTGMPIYTARGATLGLWTTFPQ